MFQRIICVQVVNVRGPLTPEFEETPITREEQESYLNELQVNQLSLVRCVAIFDMIMQMIGGGVAQSLDRLTQVSDVEGLLESRHRTRWQSTLIKLVVNYMFSSHKM